MKKTIKNNFVFALLGLFVLCFIAYSNTFHHGFLLDDYTYLIGEDNLLSVSTGSLFIKPFKEFFRPVGSSFLKAELMLFGENPVGYHVVNLILFLAVCYLFFLIVFRLTKNFELAFLTSCLYAVHPIHNFLVNYKSANMLSLYVLSMQISTIFFLKYLDNGRKKFYALSLIFYSLSLLSHEVSAMLPVYLFFILYFFHECPLAQKVKRCLPYLIILAVYLPIRMNLPEVRRIDNLFLLHISFEEYLASLMNLTKWYLSKLMIPKDILFIWDEKIAGNVFQFWHFFVIVAVLSAFIYCLIKGKKDIRAFGLSIFILGFLPMFLGSFTYAPILHNVLLEPHWFAFSSIGFFIFMASLFLIAGKRLNYRIVTAAILIFLMMGAFWTRKGNTVWKDEQTITDYWLGLNKLNGTAWVAKAKIYIRDHDQGLNKRNYNDCNEVADLAGAYHFAWQSEAAIKYFQMALEMNPECGNAYYGLGMLYKDNENYPMAEEALKTAVTINPQSYPAYEMLIEVYEKQGKNSEAEKIREMMGAKTGKGN